MKHYITICEDYLENGCNIQMGDTVEMSYYMDKEVDSSLFDEVKESYVYPNTWHGILKVKILEYFHVPNTKAIVIGVDMPKEVKEYMKQDLCDWEDLSLDVSIDGEKNTEWLIGHSFKDNDLVFPYLSKN